MVSWRVVAALWPVRRQLSIARVFPSACWMRKRSIGRHWPLPCRASTWALVRKSPWKPFACSSSVIWKISWANLGGGLCISLLTACSAGSPSHSWRGVATKGCWRSSSQRWSQGAWLVQLVWRLGRTACPGRVPKVSLPARRTGEHAEGQLQTGSWIASKWWGLAPERWHPALAIALARRGMVACRWLPCAPLVPDQEVADGQVHAWCWGVTLAWQPSKDGCSVLAGEGRRAKHIPVPSSHPAPRRKKLKFVKPTVGKPVFKRCPKTGVKLNPRKKILQLAHHRPAVHEIGENVDPTWFPNDALQALFQGLFLV